MHNEEKNIASCKEVLSMVMVMRWLKEMKDEQQLNLCKRGSV